MRNLKNVIYKCISNIIKRENKVYATLDEIYVEVSRYLEVENDVNLQSQIRGRLQENAPQYKSFIGEELFYTEKIRSGRWTTLKLDKKFIRYINNTFLISDDNFKTIKQVKVLDSGYIEEDNLDNVYKAKLVYKLGYNKASVIIQELNSIRDQYYKNTGIYRSNNGYGDEFEIFSISNLHNVSYLECINNYIVNGSYDGGIDAIYYKESDNVYLYQVKTTHFENDDYDKMRINYDDCIKGNIPKNAKDLFEFVKKHIDKLDNKKVIFRSISINSKRSTNYTLEYIYKMFFRNKLLPPIANNINLSILKPRIIKDGIYYNNFSTDQNNNFSFYMRADELISYLINALGYEYESDNTDYDISKYFSDNVRGTLSMNKKMISTIENEPENFIKYNNGISITGEVRDLGNKISIINPIINNGQQTITTLIKYGKNLDKIILSIKITNETDMTIKAKISQFTNDQVKVKSIDMLSLNPYIRNIQKYILEEEYEDETYFLEIYSSGKKIYQSILKSMYKENSIINLLDFIKLYFSVLNKKDLGNFKNSPNSQIERLFIDQDFDVELSFKVCKSIKMYKDYIKNITDKKVKDDLKSADLAFKYLLCKENLSVEDAANIINIINQEYFYNSIDKKSKLIDIYKSSNIINRLEEQLNIYKNSKNQKIFK